MLRGSRADDCLCWPYDIEGTALSLAAAVSPVAVMSSVIMSKSLRQTSFVNYLRRENRRLSVIEDTTLHYNCAFRFLFVTLHTLWLGYGC